MSKKKNKTLLENFFEKGERPNDEAAEHSKTAKRKAEKRKLHLKENTKSAT